ERPPPLPITIFEPSRADRIVHHDVASGEVTLEWVQDIGRYRFDGIDLTVRGVTRERFTVRLGDPLSARGEVTGTLDLERGDWRGGNPSRTGPTATPGSLPVAATRQGPAGGVGGLLER